VVDVTDGSDVHVRLIALKFLIGHRERGKKERKITDDTQGMP
jgi:hypothetical protein